jgi:hypothetical protein
MAISNVCMPELEDYKFEASCLDLRVQVFKHLPVVSSHTCENEREHPLSLQYRGRVYNCTGSTARDGLRKRLSWSGVDKGAPVNALQLGPLARGPFSTSSLSTAASTSTSLRYTGIFFLPHRILHRYVLSVPFMRHFSSSKQGVPRAEILRTSEFLATKLVENEFAAYLDCRRSWPPSNARSHHRIVCALQLCEPQLAQYTLADWRALRTRPSCTRLNARLGLALCSAASSRLYNLKPLASRTYLASRFASRSALRVVLPVREC